MSKTARVLLGLVGFAGGIGFLSLMFLAPKITPAGIGLGVGLAAVCFLIPIACVGGRAGQFAIRSLGVIVFLSYVAYAAFAFSHSPESLDPSTRSDVSPLKAIAGLFVWGLPGAYIALRGTSWLKGNPDPAPELGELDPEDRDYHDQRYDEED